MVLGEVLGPGVRVRQGSRTSMRPRVGSRGSRAALDAIRRRARTSMRPRVGSRGSLQSRKSCATTGPYFNEAPSWFSGKCPLPGGDLDIRYDFNEAPSWFSGKCGSGRAVGICRQTSMRPRVGSRGSASLCCSESTAPANFNEAPSWFSGKSGPCGGISMVLSHFNEAPSWFSGKLDDARRGIVDLEALQ